MRKILSAATLALAMSAAAATYVENFSANPAAAGWQSFGNPNLFAWNPASSNLSVTWDSAQPNSYFCRAIGSNLTSASSFLLGFDVRLTDIAVGVDPTKPYTFQIAIGLLNLAQATNAAFVRGSGFESPNLCEFDYFPAAGYEATVSTALISSNNGFGDGGFTYPLELVPGALYRVTMTYTADDRTLRSVLTSNGVPVGPLKNTTLTDGFSDFLVDHFGVASYSDAGQFPGYEGSVLAHGVVDNFVFASPPPATRVDGGKSGNHWQSTLTTDPSWRYTLECSTNLQTWRAVSPATPGNGGALQLQDTNPPPANAVYRVRAEMP